MTRIAILSLDPIHIALAILAAYGFGLAKTGIAGIGILAVAVFSIAMPGRAAVGAVLPLLIVADTFAVIYYRSHADWSHLWRLFPWAALGIALGAVAIGRISDHQTSRLIGWLLIFLSAIQGIQKLGAWRDGEDTSRRGGEQSSEIGLLARGGVVTPLLGILAGLATMVGNAAGPLMILYLLAARLPKMQFVGTAAWYFFCLNLFKLPFSVHAGLLTLNTLKVDLQLAVFVVLGALTGRPILKRIDQNLFELMAILFTAAAGMKLAFS